MDLAFDMKILLACLITIVLLNPSRSLATSPHANPTTAFDRYGRLRWEDEKARLDNFAIQLSMYPNMTGYFLVRAGKSSCKLEAQDHAIRAKNYLMKVRHIPWNRVIWRDTGYDEEFQVIIWLVPLSMTFLLPSNTTGPRRNTSFVTAAADGDKLENGRSAVNK